MNHPSAKLLFAMLLSIVLVLLSLKQSTAQQLDHAREEYKMSKFQNKKALKNDSKGQVKKQKEYINKKKKKDGKKSKSKSKQRKCISTCPTVGSSSRTYWDATLLVDLIGVDSKMDSVRLEYYLAQLQQSLIIEFSKTCPLNDISIDKLITASQSTAWNSPGGRRRLQSANTIDSKISVGYKSPPPKPDFAALTDYALLSDSQYNNSTTGIYRRRRQLEWGVTGLIESRLRNHRSLTGQTPFLCPLDVTFLERLQASNDEYFLKVKATDVTVIESSYSYL
mmetsp:Transcript_15551/g.22168  ORF Transcript_15551/g.22168 Transcript_15551/m.22168 type:complete len:280 (-) Transcript_15551:197-1036(-)